MSPRACISVLLLICFSLTLADDAQAWPRLFRRRSRSTSGSSGNAQVATKADQASSNYDRLGVYYLYERAYAPELAFADRIRVFLQVRDRDVNEAGKPLVAEVKITDLTDPDTTHVKWCPVSLESDPDGEYPVATFDVTNGEDESILQAARVYRLFVSLHRKSKEYGQDSVLGRVPSPYYVATSGDTALDLARQQIVMRGFREFYYTERGWRSGENYPMNCNAFYRWATGCCTVTANSGWTDLNRLFRGPTPYVRGGAISGFCEEGAIHGDCAHTATHTFMLLAYEEDRRRVWTLEANFNHTIEVCLRPVSSSWLVGHLVAEHIDPDFFQPESPAGAAENSVAVSGELEEAAAMP
jgi:hypothetical protein